MRVFAHGKKPNKKDEGIKWVTSITSNTWRRISPNWSSSSNTSNAIKGCSLIKFSTKKNQEWMITLWIQSKVNLARLIDLMSEGFQALSLHLDGMDTRFHGYDEWIDALGSMVIMINVGHLATQQNQDEIIQKQDLIL